MSKSERYDGGDRFDTVVTALAECGWSDADIKQRVAARHWDFSIPLDWDANRIQQELELCILKVRQLEKKPATVKLERGDDGLPGWLRDRIESTAIQGAVLIQLLYRAGGRSRLAAPRLARVGRCPRRDRDRRGGAGSGERGADGGPAAVRASPVTRRICRDSTMSARRSQRSAVPVSCATAQFGSEAGKSFSSPNSPSIAFVYSLISAARIRAVPSGRQTRRD